MAKKEKAEIFFADESGVRSHFHSGSRTLGVRAQTPIVRMRRQRFSLNMISAISSRGAMRFMVVKGGVGARVFIALLKRLMHGQRRPAHRAKIDTNYVATLAGKLRLYFLPPASVASCRH